MLEDFRANVLNHLIQTINFKPFKVPRRPYGRLEGGGDVVQLSSVFKIMFKTELFSKLFSNFSKFFIKAIKNKMVLL